MTPQQQTMTEKEAHLTARDMEHQTTARVLKAFPADQASFKPHPTSMSALETAWMVTATQYGIANGLERSELPMEEPPASPKTWEELIRFDEKTHAELMRKVGAMSDEVLAGTIRVPVAKNRTEEYRRIDVLNYFLRMSVHHRGQLSTYLRMVGGKVPSIYGPSGDETWD